MRTTDPAPLLDPKQSEVRQARARLAALCRHHPDDQAALQAARDRLLVANLQALMAGHQAAPSGPERGNP